MALCPFHPDSNPSLKVDPEKGFFYCFGCQAKGNLSDFLNKLQSECGVEVDMEDKKFMKTKKDRKENEFINYDEIYQRKKIYFYIDLNGNLAYKKIRYESPKKEGFRQKTFYIDFTSKDKKLIFYNLAYLNYLKEDKNKEIWFAEGEKCVDAIEESLDPEAGTDYNCIVLGFSNPESEFSSIPGTYLNLLKDRTVRIFVDNDEPGRKKAFQLVELLKKYVKKIYLIQFNDKSSGYDIADFLEEGNPITDAISLSEIVYEVRKFSGNITDILNYEVPEQKFILQNNLYVPTGVLSIIAGSGGLGKSYLSLYFALELMSEGKNVSMITLEDPIEKIIERMQRLLKKYQKTIDKDTNFTVYEYQEQNILDLVKNILENESDVLFIDPIGSIFEDENDNTETSKFMRKLSQIVISTKKNVFLVHHIRKFLNKTKEKEITKEDLYDMVRGASAIPNTAKHVVYVRRWKEDKDVLEVITIKHNYYKTNIDFRIKNLFEKDIPIEIERFEFTKSLNAKKTNIDSDNGDVKYERAKM